MVKYCKSSAPRYLGTLCVYGTSTVLHGDNMQKTCLQLLQ